jgi:CBS domain-containing protein
MLVKQVMHTPVITVLPSATVAEAARIMLDHGISGLPVVDSSGRLRGIVTEGDFLRRTELGTELQRPRWLEYFLDTGKLAEEYAHAHGRKVEEVMRPEPITCRPDESLETIVDLMERRHIKRLPVLENGRVVGIISRSDLLRALLSLVAAITPGELVPDWKISATIDAAMKSQTWAGSLVQTAVKDGVVTLTGTVFDERQQQALRVLVENVPGVKRVIDELLWIEPVTATVLGPREDQPS